MLAGIQGFNVVLTAVNMCNVSVNNMDVCISGVLSGQDSFTYSYASHTILG